MKRLLLILSLVLCVVFSGVAQDRIKITGTVQDSKGEPLVGVQVIPVGAVASGGLTDLSGNFQVNVPKSVKQLSFTYIGFAKHTLNINGAKTFKVVMHEESTALTDVVVTGYGGKVRRNQVTNSISTVKKEALCRGVCQSSSSSCWCCGRCARPDDFG